MTPKEPKENDEAEVIFELLHDIVREAAALDKAVAHELFHHGQQTGGSSRDLAEVKFHKGLSFYRALEWKIERGELSREQAYKMLGILLREVDRFLLLIQNLFGYFNADQTLAPNRSEVEVKALVQEVVDLFEPLAEAKGVEIHLRLMKDPVIYVDREMIRRVLANLLDNAIKYSYSTTEGGDQRYIVIECRRHSIHDDCLIEFDSYGVGIEEDEIKSGYIFQYGARGRHARDRGRSGTGIGLAEAKRLVEAHHGKLQVESIRLKGLDAFLTSVRVVLPHATRR